MLYPLIFQPIFKERVWGGRRLQTLYAKPLPPGAPIGESWEISDRPGDMSIVANGPLAGRDLRWLMEHHLGDVMGKAHALDRRFPLLVKILDAQETLSLQVHPPAARAAELGGEPKTEMWHITEARPGAELFVGLKRGVTRAEFERRIQDGSVADCFHRLPVHAGDTMLLPSGRVHALGAGIVLFEIQQNSDTTYRVFDWNRVGLDGKPRTLHLAESLASIDFDDFEPSLCQGANTEEDGCEIRFLVNEPEFAAATVSLQHGDTTIWPTPKALVLAVVEGEVSVKAGGHGVRLAQGQSCLVPAAVDVAEVQAKKAARLLRVTPG